MASEIKWQFELELENMRLKFFKKLCDYNLRTKNPQFDISRSAAGMWNRFRITKLSDAGTWHHHQFNKWAIQLVKKNFSTEI